MADMIDELNTLKTEYDKVESQVDDLDIDLEKQRDRQSMLFEAVNRAVLEYAAVTKKINEIEQERIRLVSIQYEYMDKIEFFERELYIDNETDVDTGLDYYDSVYDEYGVDYSEEDVLHDEVEDEMMQHGAYIAREQNENMEENEDDFEK